MATFISTLNFTDQGIQNIKNTCERAEAFKSAAEGMGVNVQNIYWTLGSFDGVAVFDAPDDETATALMLQVGSKGSVKTQTCRAYQAEEMQGILGKLSD